MKLCAIQNIHIGGDLSITDVLTALWQDKLRFNLTDLKDECRDRFVLSKGHAAAVVSFEQSAAGYFDKQQIFDEYAQDWGKFSMHSCNIINPYVEISTGSLGHGMPIACGMAAGLKLKGNEDSFVYTLMGDGEQAEGSIWEAAMNAVHYGLGNLVAIIDHNRLEADGFLDELTGIGNIRKKYEAFGWNVIEIDGNNMIEIVDAFDSITSTKGKRPILLLCNTIKGKGVPLFENQPQWHAGKISIEQRDECIEYLVNRFEEKWRTKID